MARPRSSSTTAATSSPRRSSARPAANPSGPATPGRSAPAFLPGRQLRQPYRCLSRYDLPLADHGDAAAGHDQTTGSVVLLVHPDRGTFGDDDVLVQDGVLYDGVAADQGIVQDYRPVHPGPAVHLDSGRQDRVADQPAGDDDAVA